MSQRFVAVPVEPWIDPERVFGTLEAGSEHVFWLDAGIDATSGWSWVGTGAVESDAARVRDVVLNSGSAQDWPAGAFQGGWVGWIGYEQGARRAGAHAAPSDLPVPDELWLRAERWFAFDHASGRVWAVAAAGDVAGLAREVMDTRFMLSAPVRAPVPVTARARHTPSEYAALVERCRGVIREGDAYQLCLTTRFDVPAPVDPVEVYHRLRRTSPAHHGGVLRSGDVALASASPERFLEVDGTRIRTRPIKGTRPRGREPADDARLAADLLASEKERAENVMIVDLMRNDLSQVCDPATVSVDALLEVESYPAVHQLVSVVSGRPRTGTTVGDLLAAAFPAGSMTGAPKLSAMNNLHELEGGARGVFAGCFGWVGVDGRVDLAMVIRSVVIHPRGAYVGAGGGITWLSDPAEEVAEVGIKALAPLAALGAGLPPGW